MAKTINLNIRIEELKGELALCRVAMGKRVSSASLNCEDVLKLKKFVGTRSTCDVDNFLWMMENYFRAKCIIDDAVKVNTASMFLIDITLLWWQDRLKPWVRQEVEQKCVQEQLEAMTVAESVIKLGLGKDKLEYSKSEERGVYEKDHKEDDDGKGNGDNSGNGKPQVGKKKPNKKRDKLKCFLCDCPHMLKKCPKKFTLFKKKKSVVKALRLGSYARGVKTKEAKSKKKLLKCFLCHGSKKSVIEWDGGADKEPKKLCSSKGKVKAKRVKRSKKKRVKCFLCRGPHELRNCPKQSKSIVVKEKTTSEFVESSEGLPHKEDVSLSSNLREKVVMKTVKL
ncbi:hypothetical protein Gogos_022202 [Gossypium gossypioides]|uniref:Uncharacterized protein n=1 Tax=Gossypium gossypioides TaxID=34282 RepID=A0A7J9D1J8_GOSGO|nr:hypothetical protein [Gossypium gossypioides]